MSEHRDYREIDNDVKRKEFYVNYRTHFEDSLDQKQVDGFEAIFDAYDFWEDTALSDPAPYGRKDVLDNQLGYILATAYGEVSKRMRPVREGFKKTDQEAREHVRWMAGSESIPWVTKDYAAPHPVTKQSYFGRGFVQLTHYDNYLRMSMLIYGDDRLVWEPGLALDPKVAARIIVLGMGKGVFTGVNLWKYINSQEVDFFHARRIINGMDRAEKFRQYAVSFERCIELHGN